MKPKNLMFDGSMLDNIVEKTIKEIDQEHTRMSIKFILNLSRGYLTNTVKNNFLTDAFFKDL